MKNHVMHLCLLLALASMVLCFANAIPAAEAAEADYAAYRLTAENMLYPSHYYSTVEMTDTPKEHTFIKIASGYPDFGCDNRNNTALCSKPYKFNELYDYYVANGSTGKVVIPCCVLDLALGGDPVEVVGFALALRSHLDCRPIHLKIQVATDPAAKNWVTVCDATDIVWESVSKRWYFDPIDAYQIRVIALDIDEVNKAEEGDYYDPIQGDETRFTYSEVDVLVRRETVNTTTPTQRPTQNSTQNPTQVASRPAFQFPVSTTPAATTQPTTAPVATAKPTTPAATTAPTTPVATAKPTTPAATTAPTAPVDTTPAATFPVASDPTISATTPVETLPVDATEPSAPVEETVDPSIPTEETVEATVSTEEIVAPTEEVAAPTEPATEPATEPTINNDGEEKPDNTAIIIVAVAAAAAVIGGAAFFIVKKKKKA